jgi:hypothetical protein
MVYPNWGYMFSAHIKAPWIIILVLAWGSVLSMLSACAIIEPGPMSILED